MKDRQWRELGNALQTLRETQDLTQDIVVGALNESMGERMLRAYESGEQRPRRNRLLKLLCEVFEIRNPLLINRYLKLAGYALITERDVNQYSLQSAANSTSHLSVQNAGPPADFRIEVKTLIVLDGQGHEIWRYEFPTRFQKNVYEDSGVRKCSFGDIDGDAGVEMLFVFVPENFGSVGTALFCFSEDGTLKWRFEPGRAIRDTRQEYRPPFFISNVRIVPLPDSSSRIMVSSNHYLHNPNQIAMLDSKGNLIGEYWHSGHLLHVVLADINGDGIEEILLGGVNNGYRQATLVILDPRRVNGASRQPVIQILDLPPGTEESVVLFPRTCVSRNSEYNRVTGLNVTVERRIVLATAEGVSEDRNPGVMIYELDFDLHVISARPDSHLKEAHRSFELDGKLDHSWTEDENERLKAAVIVNSRS